jgi:hypothetical protein
MKTQRRKEPALSEAEGTQSTRKEDEGFANGKRQESGLRMGFP